MSKKNSPNAPLRDALAANGKKLVTKKQNRAVDGVVDALSEIIATASTLSPRELDTLAGFLNQLADRDTRSEALTHLRQPLALPSGTAASSAMPALGAGSGADAQPQVATQPSVSDEDREQQALQTVLTSNKLTVGQRNALQRILVPSHPDKLEVDDQGTPFIVTRLAQENDRIVGDNKTLADKMADLETQHAHDVTILEAAEKTTIAQKQEIADLKAKIAADAKVVAEAKAKAAAPAPTATATAQAHKELQEAATTLKDMQERWTKLPAGRLAGKNSPKFACKATEDEMQRIIKATNDVDTFASFGTVHPS